MTELTWGLNRVNGPEARGAKVSRSISYTGCWTCRKRRVKCDERPGACGICEEAKLVCAGYDVRLIWNAGQNGRLRKPRESRRQIKLDKNTCLPMTEDEVMQTIARIDKSADNPSTATFGPFSVFRLRPSSPPDSTTVNTRAQTIEAREGSHIQEMHNDYDEIGSQHKASSLDDIAGSQSTTMDDSIQPLNTPLTTAFDSLSNSPEPLANPTSDHISYTQQDPMEISGQALGADLSGETLFCHDRVDDERRMVVGPFSLVSASLQKSALMPQEMDGAAPETPSLSDRFSHPASRELMKFNYGLSTTLVENTTAAMLIHHYTKHMVHLMQPVFHQGNPFRTIYLPLAIEGSPDLEVSRDSDTIYSASVTVFHSLLSTAATHLHSQQARDDGLRQLACHHKQRALIALRSVLARRSSNYKDLMTAILSLVSADIIDGGTHDHWIHLEAAIQLQASRHHASLVSRETRQLNSICKMLHLFAQTALPQPQPKPWPGVDRVPNGADFDYLEPSIEFIYGITTSIARAILKIHRFAQYITYYKDREYPQSLMQACETLGDELSSWKLDPEPFSAIDPEQEQMLKIARAQMRAFYYAALIYYYRSIQSCARNCLHAEQQAAIAAMNEAEDLKLSLGEDSSLPAPITWPAFIASCEAVDEDRQHWDQWWSRVQKYRMGNYSKQQSIVRSVWAELDSNETLIDWREALVAMNLRIIPV